MTVPGSLAIAVLGGDRADRERLRAWADDVDPEVQVCGDGPLWLAYRPDAVCALSASDGWLCLLDGVLYERPGPGPTSETAGDAAWLGDAFARRGPRLFADLRGDFWALVWDRKRGRGALLTDHLGVRAPYLAGADGPFVCASEQRLAVTALARPPAPDPLALAHWLMATSAPDGRTLHAGIRRLAGGHWLELGAAGAGPATRYWQPAYRPPRAGPRAQVVAEVRAALRTAVTRRLPSEPGRTGVLLSGGLDSSVVAALGRHLAPGLTAYSAVFPDHADVDESGLIALTRERLGLPGTAVVVGGGSVIAGAVSDTRAWGAPPLTPNTAFWTPLFARAGHDGRQVMLDGEGGDEVFGAAPYLLADRLRSGHWLAALRLATRWPGWQGERAPEVILSLLRRYGARGALPPAAHLLMRRLRPLRAYAPDWLGDELAGAWLDSERSAFAFKELGGPRWWSYLVEATTRVPAAVAALEATRRRGARAGVQARHPLLDVDLIELILGLDPELAFDPRFTRPLLREAMAGELDDAVRLRNRKQYFDRFIQDSLAGPDLPLARRLLDPREAELGRFVDVVALYRLLFAAGPRGHPLGLALWSQTVWQAVTAETWLRLEHGREIEVAVPEPLHRFEVHRTVEA